MEQSTLTTLIEQATTAFFSEITLRQDELLAREEGDALAHVTDEIGTAIDALLDERNKDYTHMLLRCCQERPDLFITQPDALSCILEHESYGRITAQHCVYHNLYDLIRNTLEFAFVVWHQNKSQ
ncbi:MAG TPA: hypothetical protein VEL31_12365 [Ktedonobacteraceae bacterium]|nr:hypothetical protein [Ktedonobacteraceae bacterium]